MARGMNPGLPIYVAPEFYFGRASNSLALERHGVDLAVMHDSRCSIRHRRRCVID